MSTPTLYKEIRRMAEKKALHTKTAREIVRKSGVRPGVAGTFVPTRPVALIDSWIERTNGPLDYQYLLDLSEFAEVRFENNSGQTLYLMHSENISSVLDPSDFSLLANIQSNVGDLLNEDEETWIEIPAEKRMPLRLAFSSSDSQMIFTEEIVAYPFGFWVSLLGR